MLDVRRILHPTDFSADAEAAFAHAVALARHLHAEIHLLHTVASFGPSQVFDRAAALREPDLYYRQRWTVADRKMQHLTAACEAADVPIRHLHARGLLPAPVILDYAQRARIDLIVLGRHGQHDHPRALGSSAAEILRGAPCPLCFSGARQHDATPGAPRRILVPIDIAHPADDVLRISASLAFTVGARIDLLHVIDPAYQVGDLPTADLSARDAVLEKHLRSRLGTSTLTAAFDVTFTTLAGHPYTEVLRFARAHATDLIVIASPTLSRTQYFPHGSLTEHVVSNAPCPTFVTRSTTPRSAALDQLPQPARQAQTAQAPPSLLRRPSSSAKRVP